MKREPFSSDIEAKKLLQLPGTLSVKQRVDYLLKTGGVMVVTGDVGTGKSTSIRWTLSHYHKSELLPLYIMANSGSSNELYKQFCWELNINIKSGSKSLLIKEIHRGIKELIQKRKEKVLIIIDEASLLRSDVFAELHTVAQSNLDSQNIFSLILVGQVSLLDKLQYRTSLPLASRVITRSHLESINREQMSDYLEYHLKLTGVKKNIFSENAITAIHQGSGGLLRKANSLARGGMIACMIDEESEVSEEHIRKASTELL